MSVSPRDLLREASDIAKREDSEAARRSAISKAYYAAYHAARIFHATLPRPGRSKVGVGEHENLIHQLRNPDNKINPELAKKSVAVGELLLRLRPFRVTADYEIEADVGLGALHDALALAAQILNQVSPKKPA